MNGDQREEEIRRRVDRWLALKLHQRMTMPGAVYGELADQHHLVVTIDELRRQLAHYERAPTATMRAMPGTPTPTTAVRTLPETAGDPCEPVWDRCLDVAKTQVDAALVRATREHANPYEMRLAAAAAVEGLRHQPRTAPALLPPAEPPPFTVG